MLVIITLSQSGRLNPMHEYEIMQKVVDIEMDWLSRADTQMYDYIAGQRSSMRHDEVADLDDASTAALIKKIFEYMSDENNSHVVECTHVRVNACGAKTLEMFAAYQ